MFSSNLGLSVIQPPGPGAQAVSGVGSLSWMGLRLDQALVDHSHNLGNPYSGGFCPCFLALLFLVVQGLNDLCNLNHMESPEADYLLEVKIRN